jgi:hypothetical protein
MAYSSIDITKILPVFAFSQYRQEDTKTTQQAEQKKTQRTETLTSHYHHRYFYANNSI